jgi:flavodoxin short chain
MAKALIVYGSTTGNTEMVAEQIGGHLLEKGTEVTVKNVTNTFPEDLSENWDCVILGASTWGDSEIEFQEDFEPFYENLDKVNLKNRKIALFGCGDSGYEHYCGAVDLLVEKMGELGAVIMNDPLRIDGEPDDSSSDIKEWAAEVGDAI